MDNINVERKTNEWSRTRKRRKAWQRVLAGMMAVVVFSTTYALILPAITKEQETFCGVEEHEHIDACYERVLICGYPADEQGAEVLLGGGTAAQAWEGEETDAATTDADASNDGILTSPSAPQDDSVIEDVTPTPAGEDEGDEARAPVISDATQAEPVAEEEEEGGSGYAVSGQGEADGGNGVERASSDDRHVHTDECYELQLKCELEAHAHSLACFSDPEADLEDEAAWAKSVEAVELTGVWADDVLTIARSQLGQGESENNYKVNEHGDKQGYTRYAAWWNAEAPYDPWCAMFVSFCLDFAGVDKELFPQYAGCAQWQSELETLGLWREAAFYTPAPGDVIFFDYDFDALADHVGLVAEISEEALKTIEGNNSTKVEKYTYELNDERILGYGVLPVNPAAEGDVTPAPAGEDEGRAVEDAGPYEGTAAQNEEIVRLSTEAAGVKITLTGPKSSLPWPLEELELWASPVTDPAAVALIEEGLETPAGMTRRTLLFDIRIYHNGVEVQPEGDVLVRFGGVEVPNNDAQVFYVDPETETVEEETVKQGKETLSFETDHFSIRGITYTTQNIGDTYVPGAASVTALSLRTVTGTKDWDGDDNDGNDWVPDNDLVRSFDTIFYNVGYTLNLNDRYAYLQQQGRFKGFTTARLYVRASLPLTEDKAIFDKSAMPWLHVESEVSDLTHQEIFGYYELTAGALDYIVPSTGTLRFAIYVKAMQDTDKAPASLVQPTLYVWLDQDATPSNNSDDNAFYNPTTTETVTPAAVRVSSKPSYNLALVELPTGRVTRNGQQGHLINMGFRIAQSGGTSEKGLRGSFLDLNAISFDVLPWWNKSADITGMTNPVCVVDGHFVDGLLWNYGYVDDSNVGLVSNRPLYDDFGIRESVLGLDVLPYSNSSQRTVGDSATTLYQSGDLSRADKGMKVEFVHGVGYRVSLSGIAYDGVFPERTADGKSRLPVGERALASGLLQFFYPDNLTQYRFLQEVAGHCAYASILQPCTINGTTAYIEPDTTDNGFSWYTFTATPGGHSCGVNVSEWLSGGGSIPSSRIDGSRVAGSRGSTYRIASAVDVAFQNTNLSGADLFVKFDPFFEVPDNLELVLTVGDTNYLDPSSICYVKYLSSADKNGWTAAGGEIWQIFPEIHITQPETYRLYDSLQALEDDGAVCSGLWFRFHNEAGVSTSYLGASHLVRVWFSLKLREDAPVGDLTIIQSEQRSYVGTVPTADFRWIPPAQYYNFDWNFGKALNTTNTPPLYLETNPSLVPYAIWCAYGYWYNSWDEMGNPVGEYKNWHQEQTLINVPRTQWNDGHGPVVTPYGGRAAAVFRVLGDDYKIAKTVAQESAPGVPRGAFMIDQGETLVDYVLSPASNGGEVDRVVTITDTLPAQMKFVPDSAYIGGDYTQPANSTSSGGHTGTQVPDDGSWLDNVTVCEGKTGRVKLDVSADGRTLTWTLEGVDSGKEMPKLYYTAEIQQTGNPLTDPRDQQQLVNTATITYAGNNTAFSEELGNKATATITVQKLDTSTLIKKVEQPQVGQDEVIRYRIEYTNDSPNPVGNVIIRDILPYDTDVTNDAPDGDPRGSKLHGSYVVNSVTVERADGNVAGNWNVTTTTDTSVRNYHDDLFNSALDGLADTNFAANSSPTMLEITGTNVGPYAKITVTIAIKPTGNRDKDIYYNDAAVDAYVDAARTTRAIPAPVYAAPVHAAVKVDTVELTVKKQVLVGSTSYKFPIRVSWTTAAGTTSEELSLADGEQQVLTIPVGAAVTVKETEHAGYTVMINELVGTNETPLSSGDEHTFTSLDASKTVIVVNTAGEELPNSGGMGTALPVGFGLATMASVLGLGVMRRRRRGEA